MNRKILTLAVLALLATTPAFAQQPVYGHVTSDTAGTVSMLVRYIGTAAGSATTDIEVTAGGDINFRVAGAADTTVNTTGTIDCSTPPAGSDTMGEVVDLINASANWRAVLVAGLRTDATDNVLQTRAVTTGARAEGVPLYLDSAVALFAAIPMVPENCKTDIRCWIGAGPAYKPLENPANGSQAKVLWIEGYATYATTGTFYVYSVKPRNVTGTGSEVATLILQEAAGASGTNKQLTQLQNVALMGRPNEKVIVRLTTTGASSAFNLHAYGHQIK